jgi:hypothetical protein
MATAFDHQANSGAAGPRNHAQVDDGAITVKGCRFLLKVEPPPMN